MSEINAIYRNGVFEPLESVPLPNGQPVRLTIQPAEVELTQSWLSSVRQLQAAVLSRQGPLPDSAPDIALDRLR